MVGWVNGRVNGLIVCRIPGVSFPEDSHSWLLQAILLVAAAGFEPATKGWYVIGADDIRGGGLQP